MVDNQYRYWRKSAFAWSIGGMAVALLAGCDGPGPLEPAPHVDTVLVCPELDRAYDKLGAAVLDHETYSAEQIEKLQYALNLVGEQCADQPRVQP